MDIEALRKEFCKLYGEGNVRVFTGPGRINLIGEHIDYNGGYVMPAAIDMRSACAMRVRDDGRINLASTSCGYRVSAFTQELHGYEKLPWGNYQLGMLSTMKDAGYEIFGMDMLFDETVPHGGGLSASAAIETATGEAAAAISYERTGKRPDAVELALLAQRAENEYVGMNCGIMDQFASAMGKKGCAMLLNCAKLEHSYAPLDLKNQGVSLVIMNTNKPHSLIKSAYNTRRDECERALKLLQKKYGINALCELGESELENVQTFLADDVLYRRVRHTVSEQARTISAYGALMAADVHELGRLLNESHSSLRYDYEVTGDELDAIVDGAMACGCCLGARMMGGGFGGCAIALVQTNAVDEFKERVGREYEKRIGYVPTFYDVQTSDGAREIV